jgi:DNA polymerase-3 subunit delta
MGERRVVIAQNADRLVSNEGGRETLAAYFDKPMTSTRLILSATKVDLRKKPFNDIKKLFDVVECKRPPERVLPSWIQSRARALGKTMTAETASLLLAYAGSSLLGLVGEIEKLTSFVGSRKEITSDDVAEAVGATRGATIFDLLDAVGRRDATKAATIVHRMKLAGEQTPMIVANLARHFVYMLGVADGKRRLLSEQEIATKLSIHPYRVTLMSQTVGTYTDRELIDAVHGLRELDRISKTSAGDPSVALDMFIVRVLSRGSDDAARTPVRR